MTLTDQDRIAATMDRIAAAARSRGIGITITHTCAPLHLWTARPVQHAAFEFTGHRDLRAFEQAAERSCTAWGDPHQIHRWTWVLPVTLSDVIAEALAAANPLRVWRRSARTRARNTAAIYRRGPRYAVAIPTSDLPVLDPALTPQGRRLDPDARPGTTPVSGRHLLGLPPVPEVWDREGGDRRTGALAVNGAGPWWRDM